MHIVQRTQLKKMTRPPVAKPLCVRVDDQPKPLCNVTEPIVRTEARDVTKQQLARQRQGKDCKLCTKRSTWPEVQDDNAERGQRSQVHVVREDMVEHQDLMTMIWRSWT